MMRLVTMIAAIFFVSVPAWADPKGDCLQGDMGACYQWAIELKSSAKTDEAKVLLQSLCDEKYRDSCRLLAELRNPLPTRAPVSQPRNFESGGKNLSNKGNDRQLGDYLPRGRYVNDRYGFSLVYPGNLFVSRRVPDAGDGIILSGPDGLEVRVFGSMFDENIEEAYHNTIGWEKEAGSRITYKKPGRSWFVISGFLAGGDRLFYQKTFFKDGVSVTIRFVYRIRDKDLYDPLVEEMTRGIAF